MTESEIFDSTNSVVNATEVYKFTTVSNLYTVLEVVALDVFENRYEIFFMPLSFTKKGKESLQRGLKDFKYAYVQQNDVPFLISVFNRYEADLGKPAALELLDWMRNVEHNSAKTIVSGLSSIFFTHKRSGKFLIAPPRVERYFGLWQLLREQFSSTMGSRELDTSWFESKWDLEFHSKHTYDYYGEMENTWNPADSASIFGNVICGKIAWENSCNGSQPSADEMKLIRDWIIANEERLSISDFPDLNELFISPVLKAEYVKRKIIVGNFP